MSERTEYRKEGRPDTALCVLQAAAVALLLPAAMIAAVGVLTLVFALPLAAGL